MHQRVVQLRLYGPAIHQLCAWLLYQNAAKHLTHVSNGSEGFKKSFSDCVYDMNEEEDFPSEWDAALDDYDL